MLGLAAFLAAHLAALLAALLAAFLAALLANLLADLLAALWADFGTQVYHNSDEFAFLVARWFLPRLRRRIAVPLKFAFLFFTLSRFHSQRRGF